MKKVASFFLIPLALLSSCGSEPVTTKPVIQDITESVYASGGIKSKNQYQVFATVSGIVDEVFVDEGSPVEIGTPILLVSNDAQKLMMDNAKLSAEFNALNKNHGKLDEARSFVNLTKSQMINDSIMLERQIRLWKQKIGTKVTLEQKELAYENSSSKYRSAKEQLDDLTRQLQFLSKQAQNNLLISTKTTSDYLLKSKISGKVYQLNVRKGEIVTPQVKIATIGDDHNFILEMQVDEYDIVAIKLGMPVMVVLNSYRDSVFKAVVTKINPIMNLQSKTFTIEAEFVKAPQVLYPNISFEANIITNTKKEALLIPRNYLLNDSLVINKMGEKIVVKTGLKDYQMVEILLGIDENTEIIVPE